MPDAILVCAVLLGSVAGLGAMVTANVPRWGIPGRMPGARRRVEPAVDACVTHLGRPATALVVALSGWALTLVVGWVLGAVAHALEDVVDRPVFGWFAVRQVEWWSSAWWVITNMGAPRVTQGLTAVGALVLAVLWRRRGLRWWVPLVALPAGYAMEKYGQVILKLVVDRGHPPTTHGTWPSGGCARVVLVYGLIVVLALLWRRPAGVRAWAGGLALVAFAVSVQAYARTYNQEHWVTDVAGGVVFGWLLLGTAVAAVLVLDREVSPGAGSGSTSEVGAQPAPVATKSVRTGGGRHHG